MKKSVLVLLLVLVAHSFVFASDDLDGTKGAAKAVITSTSTNTYNLLYTSTKAGWVKVIIKNEDGDVVMVDEIMNRKGFVRPYNFDGMPAGAYKVEVLDAAGKTELAVSYSTTTTHSIRKAELKATEDNKYELRLIGSTADAVQITIYDSSNQVVYSETLTQKGSLSRVYNLEKASIQGGTFEISADGKIVNSIRL